MDLGCQIGLLIVPNLSKLAFFERSWLPFVFHLVLDLDLCIYFQMEILSTLYQTIFHFKLYSTNCVVILLRKSESNSETIVFKKISILHETYLKCQILQNKSFFK